MFVRAVYYREKKTVHYFDENDEETLYIGGSFAWRMNNPGNLAKPGRRVIPGVIGSAQRTSDPTSIFCIFEDREAGEKARIKLLKDVYGNRSIAATMEKYAPRFQNDTDSYIAYICKQAQVPKTTVINEMTPQQFDAMLHAIEVREGNFAGKIVNLGKPKGVALRDMVQQPVAKKDVHLTSGSATVKLTTDTNGALPSLYPDLFTTDLDFHFGDPTIATGTEKIGTVSSGMFKTDLTFVAPYFLMTSNARPHESKVAEATQIHIVKGGETLTGIAAKYGVTRDDLAGANNITDINKIFDRQHLKIPGGGSHASAGSTSALASNPKPVPAVAPAHSPAAAPVPEHASASMPQHVSATPVAHPVTAAPHVASPPLPKPALPTTPASSASKPTPPKSPVALPKRAISVDQQRTDKKHPVTVLSSATLEPSGVEWCKRYQGSNSLDSLNADFKPKAKAFIKALEAAGAKVAVRAAFRPRERSYLMYNAFMICKGADVTKVEIDAGINIDWAHRDVSGKADPVAARAAAEEMCKAYSINPYSPKQKVGKPGNSRHNYGAAIDIKITQYEGKNVKDAAGTDTKLDDFKALVALGRTFGVKYFPKENMHWSDSGG